MRLKNHAKQEAKRTAKYAKYADGDALLQTRSLLRPRTGALRGLGNTAFGAPMEADG